MKRCLQIFKYYGCLCTNPDTRKNIYFCSYVYLRSQLTIYTEYFEYYPVMINITSSGTQGLSPTNFFVKIVQLKLHFAPVLWYYMYLNLRPYCLIHEIFVLSVQVQAILLFFFISVSQREISYVHCICS